MEQKKPRVGAHTHIDEDDDYQNNDTTPIGTDARPFHLGGPGGVTSKTTTFMGAPLTSNKNGTTTLDNREQFAVELRKSKKNELMTAKRNILYGSSPQPIDSQTNG